MLSIYGLLSYSLCAHKCESIMMAPQTRCMQWLRLSFKNKIILAHLAHMKKNTVCPKPKTTENFVEFRMFHLEFCTYVYWNQIYRTRNFSGKKRLKKCNSNRKKNSNTIATYFQHGIFIETKRYDDICTLIIYYRYEMYSTNKIFHFNRDTDGKEFM